MSNIKQRLRHLLVKAGLLSSISIFTMHLSYASDFKLGFVDVNKMFSTAKPAAALQQELKEHFEPQQKQLQAMNTNILNEQGQMQAMMKKAPSMDKLNAADRAVLEKLETSYQKDQMEFQQKYSVYQPLLQRAQEFASSAILNKANAILKDISDKGGYDLVLTSNQLVYAKPKYDLTDQLIAQLNKVDSVALVKQLSDLEKQPLPSQQLPAGAQGAGLDVKAK